MHCDTIDLRSIKYDLHAMCFVLYFINAITRIHMQSANRISVTCVNSKQDNDRAELTEYSISDS